MTDPMEAGTMQMAALRKSEPPIGGELIGQTLSLRPSGSPRSDLDRLINQMRATEASRIAEDRERLLAIISAEIATQQRGQDDVASHA